MSDTIVTVGGKTFDTRPVLLAALTADGAVVPLKVNPDGTLAVSGAGDGGALPAWNAREFFYAPGTNNVSSVVYRLNGVTVATVDYTYAGGAATDNDLVITETVTPAQMPLKPASLIRFAGGLFLSGPSAGPGSVPVNLSLPVISGNTAGVPVSVYPGDWTVIYHFKTSHRLSNQNQPLLSLV